MKLFKTLLIVFFFMLLIVIASCSKNSIKPMSKEEIKNVSFDYKVEYGGLANISSSIKYWIKETKMKIQMGHTIYYLDDKDNSIYTYDSSKNTAVKEPELKQNPKDVIPPVRKDIPSEPLKDYFKVYKDLLETAPKEKVDVEGVSCLLYDFSNDAKTDKFYISKESGFPIKWEYISLGTSEYKYVHKVTINNLKFNKVTNADVEVPSTAIITFKE